MIKHTFTLINYYEDDTVFLFLGHSVFSACMHAIILRASFTSSSSSSTTTFDNDAPAVAAAAAAAAAATAAVATASFFLALPSFG